jgi:hypothetical protein
MTKETKQTAVEWIENNIQSDMTFMDILGLIRQAKQMEKKQIINAWIDDRFPLDKDWVKQCAEKYYNKTFNTKEK